jgi:hypothetical protein
VNNDFNFSELSVLKEFGLSLPTLKSSAIGCECRLKKKCCKKFKKKNVHCKKCPKV